jgi:ABC-type bacteriocin/lantibiotic exporter with double-glycine peptidase domain
MRTRAKCRTDDGRFSMMRASDYLNAATSEVETVAESYEKMFQAVEKLAHFFFNIIFMAIILPGLVVAIAVPIVILFIPLSVAVHSMRLAKQRELLAHRLLCQRHYVSYLADIVENSQVIRSLSAAKVRLGFEHDTAKFAGAHLDAVKFVVGTKERVEFVQGLFLTTMFFSTAIMVNTGMLTKGQAAGLIGAFLQGSNDVVSSCRHKGPPLQLTQRESDE